MAKKPTYEELEQRVKELDKESRKREQAEEQMAMFRRFTETSGQGLGMADLEGNVIYANPTLCRFMGEEGPEDPIGKPVRTYYSEEDLPKLENEILPAVLKKGQETAEIPLLSLKGELTPTIQNVFLIRNDEGEPVCLANVLTDITEHERAERELKRYRDHLEELVAERTSDLRKTNEELQREIAERKLVEDALRESEQRFKELAELLPVSVFELDVDGNFTYSNRCGFEMFGYTREDLEKGMNALQLFIPEERQRVKQNIRKRLTGEEFEDHEYTALKKDGSKLTVLINTAAIIRDNKSVGVRGIVLDISDRKKTEEALRQERDRAQKYLDIAGVMFVAIDHDGKITLINRRGSEVLEVKPEQVIGNNWFDHFIPERMRDDIRTVFQGLMRGEVEPFAFHENPVLRSNGEEKIIAWHNTILKDEAGRIVGTLSSGEDITDRKRAEEELKKSSEQLRHLSTYLQSAREEERTSIAREIHDDLGQALTALKMDLYWLSNKLPRDQELLLNKTKSMSSLIDMTVKSVQRISSELRPGLLDDLGLSAAIEWQVGEFENRTGIKCNVAIDPEEIVLDRDRSTAIFRIFQESLTNIARHANATMVDITLEEKSDTLELKVRDNGKGITEEQISDPRSFGLIGMRERVYSLGGYLSISGTPNEGTTIMVGIPFNKEE